MLRPMGVFVAMLMMLPLEAVAETLNCAGSQYEMNQCAAKNAPSGGCGAQHTVSGSDKWGGRCDRKRPIAQCPTRLARLSRCRLRLGGRCSQRWDAAAFAGNQLR